MGFLVHFETMDVDDGQALETVEMDYVPRVGETVILRGEEYGGRAREQRFEEQMTMFKVIDVSYEIDVGKKEQKDEQADVSVTVFLELHEQDHQRSVFRRRCTCKEDQRMPAEEGQNPDHCGNCGSIAWWKR